MIERIDAPATAPNTMPTTAPVLKPDVECLGIATAHETINNLYVFFKHKQLIQY